MEQFKRILFPTDFSEGTEEVLSYAVMMAEKFGCAIDILHVVHEMIDMTGFYVPHISYDVMEKEMEEAAKKTIEKFCRERLEGKVDYAVHTRKGTPFIEIIRAARELGDGLIVIGTHGRTGLDHVLFGSTAEKVVRKAPVPVMTVRGKDRNFSMP